jgi:hypothetical protein
VEGDFNAAFAAFNFCTKVALVVGGHDWRESGDTSAADGGYTIHG